MKTYSKFFGILLASLALAALIQPLWILNTMAADSTKPTTPVSVSGENTVSAISAILSPEIQLSQKITQAGEDWFSPALAYNPTHCSQVMFAHTGASTGGIIYGFYWSHSPSDWHLFIVLEGIQPAVAYNRTEDIFLLVSMFDSDSDGHYEIWGRIVEGDTSATGQPFLIFQWANRSFWSPRVVWNSYRNEFLVVWSALDTTTGLPSDIAAARVSASGTVLPGAPHIITDIGQPHQPDVAYNLAADEYLVVWRRQGSGADWNIWGARLQGSNAALVGSSFAINTAAEDQNSPSIATNQQDRYIVVWEHVYPGPCCDWDIRGQELDINGSLVGDVVIVAQTLDDETNPRVVARPGARRDYIATWQKDTSSGSQIYTSRWGDANVQYDYFQVAAAAFWDYANPTLVVAGPNILYAYEGDSQGDPTQFRHIYSRYWTLNNAFLPAILR